MPHSDVLIRRNAIAGVLRQFLSERDAIERANNIAAAVQDGVTSPFVAAMQLLEKKLPNMARRMRCAELVRDAWEMK